MRLALAVVALVHASTALSVIGHAWPSAMSHQMQLAAVMEEMAARGNAATMALSNIDRASLATMYPSVKFVSNTVTLDGKPLSFEEYRQGMAALTLLDPNDAFDRFTMYFNACTKAAFELAFLDNLYDTYKPDVVLVDAVWPGVQGLVAYYQQRKPDITIVHFWCLLPITPLHTEPYNQPRLLTVEPPLHKTVMPNSFMARLGNAFMYIFFENVVFVEWRKPVAEFFGQLGLPATIAAVYEVARQPGLHLAAWPQGWGNTYTPPAMHNIGSVLAREPRDLPADLKQFMDGATEGAVLATFGTFMFLEASFIEVVVDQLIEVSKTHHVLFRLNKIETVMVEAVQARVANNDRFWFGTWLPQNDLLHHPNMRLFFSQAGVNGVYEALAGGVPMLAMPIQGDQQTNARTLVRFGIGSIIDHHDVRAGSLTAAVLAGANNSAQRRAAQRFAPFARYASKTGGAKKAADLIELAHATGGARFLNIDPTHGDSALVMQGFDLVIFTVVAGAVAVVLARWLLLVLYRLCVRLCCAESKKSKTQ